ncbi:DUF6531 domain-containing protein [Longispora fulva]|uniref:RHS repeat-associated protein n=1 Tax=Longispora fulva TaxID=619741 RepID=A0A8J7KW80_9ACTN|nr:DUF6531 domain-containing protein [Longispora fulva]MBG6136217.1 RHS repeat-associated protein [Longispora fulva]
MGPEVVHPDAAAQPSSAAPALTVTQDHKARGFVEGQSQELRQNRTKTSTVFANPDGTRTLRTYSTRAFQPSPDGRSMVAVDLAMRKNAAGRWVPTVGPNVEVAASADDPALESMDFGGGATVSLRLDGAGANVTGAASGQKITFAGARPGADVVITSANWGLKEELVLHSPEAGSGWLFPLTVTGGLIAMVDPDTGAVRFIDGAGVVRGEIPTPFMTDSKIDPRSGEGAKSYGVTYTIVANGSGQALKVDIDQAWLRDAARQYPVIVDPSQRFAADADDTFVSTTNNGNNSTAADLTVGTWNGGGERSRAYVSFGTAFNGTLQNKYILSASLSLVNTWSYSCDARDVSVYRSTDFWYGSQMRWPGSPYDATPLATKSFAHGYTPCGSNPAWETFPISSQQFTRWVHGLAPNNGFVLKASESDSFGWKRFASTQTTFNGWAPYLDVTFQDNGAEYALPSVQFNPALTSTQAGGLVVRATNWGRNTWTPKPPTGESYHLSYQVLNIDGSVRLTSPNFYPTNNVGPHETGDIPITVQPLPVGSYKLMLRMSDGTGAAFASPPGEVPFTVQNSAPRIDGYSPPQSGYATSLQPALWVDYEDLDKYPATGRQYFYKICNGTPAAPVGCQQSGWIDTAAWTVPAGVLKWGVQSWWQAQVSDGQASGPLSDPMWFTPVVAQPAVTNHLAGAPDGADLAGVNPQVGNYSTTVTDATVSVVGPDLSITRSYNSQDLRTAGAFGAGWSTPLDQRLIEEVDGNVVLTTAAGREVRFGKSLDGSYAPPQGANLTLTKNTPQVGAVTWSLRDSTATVRTFDTAGRLAGTKDMQGRQQIYIFGIDGLSEVKDVASGRKLSLTWSGGHVATVTNEAGSVWQYTYTGNQLTKVCSPLTATACVSYSYTDSSFYRSVIADDNPSIYYPMGEPSGTTAKNVAARSTGQGDGLYAGVTLARPGALPGSADTAVGFSAAANSSLVMPVNSINSSVSLALEMWFKTDPGQGGVLLSEQNTPLNVAPGDHVPMYVGTDGKLCAGFWTAAGGGPCGVNRVDNSQWHHMVLSAGGTHQELYLDGVQVATKTGALTHLLMSDVAVGNGSVAGWIAGKSMFPFTGDIDDVAFYKHELGSAQVAAHYGARGLGSRLTKVTEPGNFAAAQVGYDAITGRFTAMTDRNGATWGLTETAVGDKQRTATLTSNSRGQISYTYDTEHSGRITKREDGLGARTWEYNAAGFVSKTTDPIGQVTETQTDARGNVIATTTHRESDSSQTSYRSYYVNAADAFDPRNDTLQWQADARSTSATDTTFRVAYETNAAGQVTKTTYPLVGSGTVAPTQTVTYSTGTETAVGGGTVPAGLPLVSTGKIGQTTTNTYDAKGDAITSTDPVGLVTTFGYDPLGRVTSKSTPYGGVTTTYNALGQPATVTSTGVTNPITSVTHTAVTTYEFDQLGHVVKQSVADTTGGDATRVTTYGFDSAGRLTSSTDPDGSTTSQEWNNAGDVSKATNKAGLVTELRYNDNRQLIETAAVGAGVDPTNPAALRMVLESRAYLDNGLLASTTDARGGLTSYEYWADGLRAAMSLGEPDGAGGFTSVQARQFTYDAAGQTSETYDTNGAAVDFTYDAFGYKTSETIEPGSLKYKTIYTRDNDGNPLKTDRYDDTTKYAGTVASYDLADRVTAQTVTDRRTGSTSTLTDATTVYVLDTRGLPTSIIDPLGGLTTATYDALGQPVTTTGTARDIWTAGVKQTGVQPISTTGRNTFGEVTDAQDVFGHVTHTDVDAMGRPKAVTLPTYTPPFGPAITPVSRTTYTPTGQVLQQTDPLGRVTSFTYDKYGNLLTRTEPDPDGAGSSTSPVWTFGYNRVGDQTSTVDPTGAQSLATYEAAGRQLTGTRTERVGGQTFYYTTTKVYDQVGNILSITTPAGGTTSMAYNKTGKVTQVTDPTGRRTDFAYARGGLTSTTMNYGLDTTWSNKKSAATDLAGNLLSLTEQGNGTASTRTRTNNYNKAGSLFKEIDFTGNVTDFSHNVAGQLVTVTQKADASTPITVQLGYDVAGQRTRMVDGNGNATHYTYTPWGQPASTIEPSTPGDTDSDDRTWTTTYDAAGQPIAELLPGAVTRTRTFDGLGRLAKETGAGTVATTTDRIFGYDPLGRTTSISGPAGATQFTYNDRGLLTATTGVNTAMFGYDGDNNLTTRTDAAGTTTLGRDLAGRVTTASEPLTGSQLTYAYRSDGQLASIGFGGATKASQTYSYDAYSRLTTHTTLKPGGTVEAAKATYTYDDADRTLTKTTTGVVGGGTNTYTYDGLGRLKTWTTPSSVQTTYGWDAASNRTTVGARAYTYDARNRVKSATGGTDPDETWTYKARGALSTATRGTEVRTSNYDAFEQLRSTTGNAGATVNYTYDALGRTAQRNGISFGYPDLSNNAVTSPEGLISRDAAGQPIAQKAGSTASALLSDATHDDVIANLDPATGSVTGSTSFDPFGKPTAGTGAANLLGYQSGWTDTATGYVNAAARWDNPATGSFTSRDTWTLDPIPTAQSNRYTYANANPVNGTDPTGHFWDPGKNGGAGMTLQGAGPPIGGRTGAEPGGGGGGGAAGGGMVAAVGLGLANMWDYFFGSDPDARWRNPQNDPGRPPAPPRVGTNGPTYCEVHFASSKCGGDGPDRTNCAVMGCPPPPLCGRSCDENAIPGPLKWILNLLRAPLVDSNDRPGSVAVLKDGETLLGGFGSIVNAVPSEDPGSQPNADGDPRKPPVVSPGQTESQCQSDSNGEYWHNGRECFYRSMGAREYERFMQNQGLSLKGGGKNREIFTTRNREYSRSYLDGERGRFGDYTVLIEFELTPGSTSSMYEPSIGRRGDIPSYRPLGWHDEFLGLQPVGSGTNLVHVKADGGYIAYGLRGDAVAFFNGNILTGRVIGGAP